MSEILGDSLLVQEFQSDGSVTVKELSLETLETTEETAEIIRKTAYFKWEHAGRPEGDGVNFWLEAETEIKKGILTELRAME